MAAKGVSPPFIDDLKLPESAHLEEQVKVEIGGNWPTPNWSHIHTNIVSKNKVMTIHYIGERRPGMALQVLKPFRDTIELSFPEAGEWKVQVKSRSGDISRTILIER